MFSMIGKEVDAEINSMSKEFIVKRFDVEIIQCQKIRCRNNSMSKIDAKRNGCQKKLMLKEFNVKRIQCQKNSMLKEFNVKIIHCQNKLMLKEFNVKRIQCQK